MKTAANRMIQPDNATKIFMAAPAPENSVMMYLNHTFESVLCMQ